MKIRSTFVSNSSSSSFVVSLGSLTPKEINVILSYLKFYKEKSKDCWRINKDLERNVIRGKTNMDNGDLKVYLIERGVDVNKFAWN
jgi:hypothetical protein